MVLATLAPSPALADDSFTASGRLDLRGIEAQNKDSVKEEPIASGRLKLDVNGTSWKFHSWLEGAWDGSVRRPVQDHALFKNYDRIYQDNSPYLEFKELYLQYSSTALDLRAGVQRFAWGRLDEYPPNDLFNPWDYTQFLRKPLEDRKIGVPSISASLNSADWTYDAVWVPVFVPYRLPMPYERWSGVSSSPALSQVPNAEIVPAEPDLPDHSIENSSIGIRVKRGGAVEWALNLYNGFDTHPVLKTIALVLQPQAGGVLVDPGYTPDFHRITVIGMDAAAVQGDWSLRAEAAYTYGRYLNIRRELWGYPTMLSPFKFIYPLALSIEQKRDVLDYGIGADYRLFEDGQVTMQAQQTVILGDVDLLYERKAETLLWANLKVGWMNQKVETNLNIAYNPEHGDSMGKANAWYVFSDSWKAGITALTLNGPPQSRLGRYWRNDQAEAEVVYSW